MASAIVLMRGNNGQYGKIQICSNENHVLLSWQVQACPLFCHSQAISVCNPHHIGFSSAEGNWPSQLHHSQCLSLPVIPCPLQKLWDTSHLLEFLWKRTNVVLLLNINSCYSCDWNDEAVHLREWGDCFYWWPDFCILMTYARPGSPVFDSPWQ